MLCVGARRPSRNCVDFTRSLSVSLADQELVGWGQPLFCGRVTRLGAVCREALLFVCIFFLVILSFIEEYLPTQQRMTVSYASLRTLGLALSLLFCVSPPLQPQHPLSLSGGVSAPRCSRSSIVLCWLLTSNVLVDVSVRQCICVSAVLCRCLAPPFTLQRGNQSNVLCDLAQHRSHLEQTFCQPSVTYVLPPAVSITHSSHRTAASPWGFATPRMVLMRRRSTSEFTLQRKSLFSIKYVCSSLLLY